MARQKSFKPQLNSKTIEFLKVIDDELKSRGSLEHNISDLIFDLVSSAKSTVVDTFVSSHTPMEYKLKQLLQSPGENSKVIEILNKKTFGLQFKDSSISLET